MEKTQFLTSCLACIKQEQLYQSIIGIVHYFRSLANEVVLADSQFSSKNKVHLTCLGSKRCKPVPENAKFGAAYMLRLALLTI